jgi:apolipoprotein N-acyltransferase
MGRIFYHKQHLVPFGEYMPGRAWLSKILPSRWLQKVTPGFQDLSFGDISPVCQVEGLPPLIMMICYEAIFPPRRIHQGCTKAQWILNVTNDAWFGMSHGPYQHLASAQFRAIEDGLPLVRVANTGVSAVFDGLGRPLISLGLNQRGVLDTRLPCPLANYRSYQNVLQIFLILWLGGLSLFLGTRHLTKRDSNF